MEIHDAGAQHVAAAYDRVRDERLAAALQAIEQLAIQGIEVRFDCLVADPGAQVERARTGTW